MFTTHLMTTIATVLAIVSCIGLCEARIASTSWRELACDPIVESWGFAIVAAILFACV